MKIDGININMPAVKNQIESTANNNAGTNRDKQPAPAGNGLLGLKAVFALDKEKNVVIRFLDENGKVVRQIPPEEYINMVKKFTENIENLFSKEV